MLDTAGTSPLYLWPSVFTSQPAVDDVIGATSFVLWTLTLIVVIKYVVSSAAHCCLSLATHRTCISCSQ